MFSSYSLIGLVVLVLDVVALVKLLQSGADAGTKILWALLIILLPILGMILYFVMGPGRNKAL
ncbi:MAG TPA: PLDc N-terminal domain-containing protein [Thermoanaerobaculia bacterium]|nr:PLDc N-terminal domain-containing protein [Thermoanaerobaculia bacterium]